MVLALPFLVLYKALGLLDTRIGLILLYTLSVLPIVIWIMRDQFAGIPTELEEAALVDGLSIWGAFLTIILPIALPGMVAAFILSLVLTWNEYFFAALLTSTHANTLPVMVASQTGSPGDQLVVDGGAVVGGDPAAGGDRRVAGAVHHQGDGRRVWEVVCRACHRILRHQTIVSAALDERDGTISRNADRHARDLAPVVVDIRSGGATSLREIAAELSLAATGAGTSPP